MSSIYVQAVVVFGGIGVFIVIAMFCAWKGMDAGTSAVESVQSDIRL